VLDRVDVGDAEQVVDETARARPARGTANAHVLHELHDVGDGEEVGRVAELGDDRELVVESTSYDAIENHAASTEACLAAFAQHPAGLARFQHDIGIRTRVGQELREVHLADAEIAPRVEHAPLGQPPGRGEQVARGIAAETGAAHDVVGDEVHLLAALEIGLGVDPVDVPRVERDQPARGVENVERRTVAAVSAANGVGEDDRDIEVTRERQQSRGFRDVTGTAMAHDFDDDVVRLGATVDDGAPPSLQMSAGEIGATRDDCATDLGVGTEQHGESTRMRSDQVERRHRLAALPREMRRTHQPAHRRPSGLVSRQHRDSRQPLIHEAAAARGCPAGGGGRAVERQGRRERRGLTAASD
jgi:hypothetical protein